MISMIERASFVLVFLMAVIKQLSPSLFGIVVNSPMIARSWAVLSRRISMTTISPARLRAWFGRVLAIIPAIACTCPLLLSNPWVGGAILDPEFKILLVRYLTMDKLLLTIA